MTFLCVGSIIKFNNTQDSRLMGMLNNNLGLFSILFIAAINLGGLPFTLGYLYKSTYIQFLIFVPYSEFFFGFQLIGLLTGLIYVFNLLYYSIFDFRKGSYINIFYYIQNNKKNNFNFFLNLNYSEILA
jgi:NADH:ubiquinone oxidoreductase subunit 5 (subunit L)/multisubunit Na+/H+ antiporter MnhA subunit